MKDIYITKTKKITTDPYNYIYATKKKKTQIRRGKEYCWNMKWFYPSLKACYNDLLEEFTKDGDKETLKENVEEAVNMLKGLRIAVK